MREYALIILNMLKYACVYLNKQSSEYTRRILNVFDAVHTMRSLILKVISMLTKQLHKMQYLEYLIFFLCNKKKKKKIAEQNLRDEIRNLICKISFLKNSTRHNYSNVNSQVYLTNYKSIIKLKN